MAKKDQNQSEKEQKAKTDAAVDDLIDQVTAPEGEEQSPPPGAEPSANEADIAAELAVSREEAARNRDQYLRAQADLQNFRRRAQREKEEMARFGNENLLRELLPVLDNLERAVAHAREGEGGGEGLLQGVEMTLDQLRKVFEKSGVKEVEAGGEPFDPALHEAMGQQERSDLPPNHVAQEMQKGYLLNDRLLRPALVMVSKEPAPPNLEQGGGETE